MNEKYPLRYTKYGSVFISDEDTLDPLVDALLDTDYAEEFCVAVDFDPYFIAKLMKAGFLVMSTAFADDPNSYLLLPKLHLTRSALFFPDLHIKKSIKRLLGRYELRAGEDFFRIMENCIAAHGDDWLTKPLCDAISFLYYKNRHTALKPISFGVYRDGALMAGEFGVLAGSVYTSYSGYFHESNAGMVQLILMSQYLAERGAPFLDLGMPLPYKYDLGAVDISANRFVEIFREGREKPFSILEKGKI
jgi:Leu/Phe-tRNA-protein transferase